MLEDKDVFVRRCREGFEFFQGPAPTEGRTGCGPDCGMDGASNAHSRHRQRSVKDGQADDFPSGRRAGLPDAFGREEQRPRCTFCRIPPFAGKHVGHSLASGCVWRDRTAGLELAQPTTPPVLSFFVQHHQLDSFVRTGLPVLVLGQGNVRKHEFIEADCFRFASAEF